MRNNLLADNVNVKKFNFLILLVSIFFGYLCGAGHYGFNIDYYVTYSVKNIVFSGDGNYRSIFDFLGASLSTLAIFDQHIGVYLTSFVLALSSGLLIKKFFILKGSKSIIIFFIVYLLTLHSHPIIMSTSGAMRQGWAMSFIFFSFYMLLSRKKFLSFIFIFFTIFMHNSGIFFFLIYLFTFLTLHILNLFKNKYSIIFIVSFFLILINFFTPFFLKSPYEIIVKGDFRLLWLFINLSYIFFFYYIFNLKISSEKRFIILFLYLYSFLAISILLLKFNDQYERINMMMAIPFILIIASVLSKKLFYFFLTGTTLLYFLLTIYTGMYTLGLY